MGQPGWVDADVEAVAKVRHRLASAIRKRCPAWLAHDAEDIAQQAIVRVLQSRPAGATVPDAHVQRVAYCEVVDEIRRRRARAHDKPASDRIARTGGGPPADGNVRSNEIAEAVRFCLERLVPPRRRAVVLHLQGMGRQDIARALRWSLKQADNRMYRGLADLRRCLSERGIQP